MRYNAEMETHIHKAGEWVDYNLITDGIYVGTNQCCQMGLSDVLKKEGITADISLEEERLDQPFGVESYLWLPTKDHTPPSDSQLELGVLTLERLTAQGMKVYVHCKNGHGRAPTLVAAYLIKKGMTFEEAEKLLKKGRPETHILPNQQAALKKFERSLR